MSVRFSVIIPTYQCAAFIGGAIDSVLAQTLPAAEILVIDDGSADNTIEVVAAYGDKVRYVRQANAGPAAARNRGISLAGGDFVAFLDADDVWHPSKLRRQGELIELAPQAGVVFSNWLIRDDQGRVVYEGFDNPDEHLHPRRLHNRALGKGLFLIEDDPFAVLLDTFILHTNTLAVRRDLLGNVRYDERFNWGEDWLFCLDLARGTKFAFVDEPLAEYRERAGSICTRPSLRSITSRYEVAKAALTRYGALSAAMRTALYPRLRQAGSILGYRLMDEAGDPAGARRMWRETACSRPGMPSPKLYMLSLLPGGLLALMRGVKRRLGR